MFDHSGLILRDMSDGVLVIDMKGKLISINPAARTLLELGSEGVTENFARLFIGDRRNDGFVQAMLDALGTPGEPSGRTVDYFTGSNRKKKLSVKATFLQGEPDAAEKKLIVVLSDVTDRENAMVFRKDVTILVSILVILVCLYVFFYSLQNAFFPGVVSPSAMTYGLLGALLLLSILIVAKTSLRPKIVFRGPAARKARLSGLLFSVCAVTLLIGVKFLLLKIGSPLFTPGEPFFAFQRFTFQEIYRYLPCVILQEFVARSILQEGFIYVFGEKYGGLAVLVSSLVFGVVHLPYSFLTMVGAMLLMGVLGLFYQRNRDLVSVSLVHYVAAEAAMILGFL